jgi:Fusaric acid resistance protein-like
VFHFLKRSANNEHSDAVAESYPQFEDLNSHQQHIVALARAARAAIILPALFGLLIFSVKDMQAAGFAVFGTIAHVVMKSYDQRRGKRLLQLLTLTCWGALLVFWGTTVSMWLWLAVLSSSIVGFATQTASMLENSTDGSRTVPLLAFLLAVTPPASADSIIPRLAGWILSGVVSFVVILATWIPFGIAKPKPSLSCMPVAAGLAPASWTTEGLRGRWRSAQAKLNEQPDWVASSARVAIAAGSAVLIAGVFKLEHGFWIALGILPVLRAGAAAPQVFLQEQGGTLAGCIASIALVAFVRSHREIYWMVLPVVVFAAAYLSTAVGLLAGQAAFTVFVVVLLNILSPLGYRAGVVRLRYIATGGAISLFLGFVYPPSGELRRKL